jgi:hypothetical protein
MFSIPGILLRIEGAFVLALGVFLYRSGETPGGSSSDFSCGPICR